MRRTTTAGVLAAVLIASAAGGGTARAQEGCPEYDGIRGTEAAPSEVWDEIRRQAAAADVPAELLAALVTQETGWQQFTDNGRPVVSSDGRCGVGLLQLTSPDEAVRVEAARDWRGNVAVGAQELARVYEESQPSEGAGPPTDRDVLEGWFGAVLRYNGFRADADPAYARAVFEIAASGADWSSPATALVPYRPALRTPQELFGEAATTGRRVRATADSAVLTEADGTVVSRLTSADGWVPTVEAAPDVLPPVPRAAAVEVVAAAGLRVSRSLFADVGGDGRQADFAVVAREDGWPDSLAGAALAGARAPILFVPSTQAVAADGGTVAELRRVLGDGGTVYLLGGTAAVPQGTEDVLRAEGFVVTRLAGDGRTQTAELVAREVLARTPTAPAVVVARGFTSPADALTGGAAAARGALPLVLVGDAVEPAEADRIAALGPRTAYVLGGPAAVGEQVVEALRARGLEVVRLAGAERSATAAAIAGSALWAGSEGGFLAVDLSKSGPPDLGGDLSWAWALAAAPLSAALDAPQLGVFPEAAPEATLSAVRRAGGSPDRPVRVVAVGLAGRVGPDVRAALASAAHGLEG